MAFYAARMLYCCSIIPICKILQFLFTPANLSRPSVVGANISSQECAWDGGDCCACTCVDGEFTCGSNGYYCLDSTVRGKLSYTRPVDFLRFQYHTDEHSYRCGLNIPEALANKSCI